jgi:hypothetical protein
LSLRSCHRRDTSSGTESQRVSRKPTFRHSVLGMTIFDDLKNALAPYVGGADASGMIIGLAIILVFSFGMLIAFGKEFFKGVQGLVFLIMMVAFVSAPGVSFWPLWVPFLIVVSLLIIYWSKGFTTGQEA